jgi:hypothetical protein
MSVSAIGSSPSVHIPKPALRVVNKANDGGNTSSSVKCAPATGNRHTRRQDCLIDFRFARASRPS